MNESNSAPNAAPASSPTQVVQETPASPVQPQSAPVRRVPKKLFALIPVALLILVAVVAIIKSPRTSEVPDNSNTITWWGLQYDADVVAPLIKEYMDAHPGIDIKYEKQSLKDYRERVSNALARGNGPDIFTMHNTWVPMFKNELDTLPSTVMSSDDFTKTFFPVATADLSSGSGMYAVPLEYDGLGMYVNLDMLARYKLDAPLTWDDFKKVARSMTARDKVNNVQQSGAAFGNTKNVDHWPEILAMLMLQDGVRLSNFSDPLVIDVVLFYNGFGSDPTTRTWDPTLPPSTYTFADGRVGMYFAPGYRINQIKAQNPALNFKIYPVPQIPQDARIKKPESTYASYWVQSVWKRSHAKGISWDFLKFLSQKETLIKLHANLYAKGQTPTAYPRVDMDEEAKLETITYSLYQQAKVAQSWYVASETGDGATGLNTQLATVFDKAAGKIKKVKDDVILAEIAAEIQKILGSYRITSK